MYHTNKSKKFKTTKDFNKRNPASVYIKELKRCAELNKKRNQTARLPLNKLKIIDVSLFSSTRTAMPIRKSSKMLLEETHQKMINEMNNPKNPYSAYWSNKILERRYQMEFGVNGFINGVPIITIQKMKSPLLPLRQLQEENEEEGEEENNFNGKGNGNDNVIGDNDDDINSEADLQFKTNQKDFFKPRKDIAEEAIENEDDKDNQTPSDIEYGLIYKYFESTNSNNSHNHLSKDN